jgi:hypothetical protein
MAEGDIQGDLLGEVEVGMEDTVGVKFNDFMFSFTMLLFLLLVMIGLMVARDYLKKQYRGYYESGAHAVALHHMYRGNYGSRAFRDAAFEWGDPQDEKDINEIYKQMALNDKHGWIMYDAGGEWIDPNEEEKN